MRSHIAGFCACFEVSSSVHTHVQYVVLLVMPVVRLLVPTCLHDAFCSVRWSVWGGVGWMYR